MVQVVEIFPNWGKDSLSLHSPYPYLSDCLALQGTTATTVTVLVQLSHNIPVNTRRVNLWDRTTKLIHVIFAKFHMRIVIYSWIAVIAVNIYRSIAHHWLEDIVSYWCYNAHVWIWHHGVNSSVCVSIYIYLYIYICVCVCIIDNITHNPDNRCVCKCLSAPWC